MVFNWRWFVFIIGAATTWTNVRAESPDSTFKKISGRIAWFDDAAKQFGVNPAVLCAVVYVERTLNYDWTDEAFDIALFEQAGLNSSIGFCQVKIKTAYFIEYEFSHPESPYFPGDEFQNSISLSGTKKELLEKIVSDSLNIRYAAAYLRMIQNHWAGAGFPIDDKPEILGTLYSTGLYREDGSERKPNKHPRSNAFGNLVKESLPLFTPLFAGP